MDDQSEEVVALRAEFEARLQEVERRTSQANLDEELRRLGAPMANKNPVFHTYLANRFRDYEISLLNVKQMGYHIGRLEMNRTGVADRLGQEIQPTSLFLETKLCTQVDCEGDWYLYWLQKLKSGFVYHRKLWEFCYIAQQLYAAGKLNPGMKGLGFGCGEEPLPSLWASFGAASVPTDLHTETSAEKHLGWIEAGAHGSSREKLLHRNICLEEEKLALIGHDFADMNDIPAKFAGEFDFCWSSCAFEHLGSIEQGLAFIENTMDTLKPGGISVHTTEFNLSDQTMDDWSTVLFEQRHIEELARRLEDKGYKIAPLNFDAGTGVLDGLFDIPPWPWEVEELKWKPLYTYSHLKKAIEGIPCTSIGITVTKPL